MYFKCIEQGVKQIKKFLLNINIKNILLSFIDHDLFCVFILRYTPNHVPLLHIWCCHHLIFSNKKGQLKWILFLQEKRCIFLLLFLLESTKSGFPWSLTTGRSFSVCKLSTSIPVFIQGRTVIMTFRYVSSFSVNLPKEDMTGRCLPSPLTPLAIIGCKWKSNNRLIVTSIYYIWVYKELKTSFSKYQFVYTMLTMFFNNKKSINL